MAAEQSETPWDDFLSDFTLVLDSGERIRCHKKALANASPVLKMMLTTDMKEANTNEMNMKGYSLETVIAFLRYIYADANDIEELTMEKQDGGPALKTLVVEKNFYINNFGDSTLRIWPQLMRLAHMYQVEDLVGLCIYHLTEFKPRERRDSNTLTAKDIHKLAMDLGHEDLKQCSSMWLASDAFETLKCGSSKCFSANKETRNPDVLLKCKHCGLLTEVSSDRPYVLDKKGKRMYESEDVEDSQVSVNLL